MFRIFGTQLLERAVDIAAAVRSVVLMEKVAQAIFRISFAFLKMLGIFIEKRSWEIAVPMEEFKAQKVRFRQVDALAGRLTDKTEPTTKHIALFRECRRFSHNSCIDAIFEFVNVHYKAVCISIYYHVEV